ncbi:MAG: NAD-dependent epimerase/dehydratase family protein [Rhodoblastus sp.]|nr:NAD-dependent epimerase/dehydratase family protein [Rhodoblastus sp.]
MSPSDYTRPGARVLVTGASGFVGSAIVGVLRQRGYRVRTFARATSTRVNLDPRDEAAVGDILDPKSLDTALEDVDHIVHAAADYRLWARDPAEILRVNVEGTRLTMEAARRAGVARIVHVSSTATIRPGDGAPSDETAPAAVDPEMGNYKRSKILAERQVEQMAATDGLPVVIVNPSTPIGPRDVKPTPTGRIIVEAASGRIPAYVETGLNLAHVDDVAAGVVAALERGRIGERYILGGENVALSDLLAAIAPMVGRRPPRVRLPIGLIYPFAFGAEALAFVTGRTPFATREGLRLARKTMFFSDAKARRELGYTTRPYTEGLAGAIAWFRAAGYIA